MANSSLSATLRQKLSVQTIDGVSYGVTSSTAPDPAASIPDYTAVAAALATLVADGASPTQAHVTTLNSAWTTYKAAVDAQATQLQSISADLTVFWNKATLTTSNKAAALWRTIQPQFLGSFPVGE